MLDLFDFLLCNFAQQFCFFGGQNKINDTHSGMVVVCVGLFPRRFDGGPDVGMDDVQWGEDDGQC